MLKTTTLVFDLPAKAILNSNSMPSHFIAKGKMVSNLREIAANYVLKLHPEATQPIVEQKLIQLKAEADQIMHKKRLKKRLEAKGLTKAEVDSQLLEEYPPLQPQELAIPPLFNKFTMLVEVYPPSRRRLDPPNLWPTVKALTDGATDGVAWPDDDFEHLLETSFRYGGLSGSKDWQLAIIVTEVSDYSAFQTVAEVRS